MTLAEGSGREGITLAEMVEEHDALSRVEAVGDGGRLSAIGTLALARHIPHGSEPDRDGTVLSWLDGFAAVNAPVPD